MLTHVQRVCRVISRPLSAWGLAQPLRHDQSTSSNLHVKSLSDRPKTLAGSALLVLLTTVAGCGYTTRGLYLDSVQTVAVPVFRSTGMRREIELQLTEKVIQAIESRTPYKVVAADDADTELRGTVTAFYKNPFGEDQYDNPRGGNMVLGVQVSWIRKGTGEVITDGCFEFDQTFGLTTSETFTVDIGQSSATATAEAVDKMANRIVSLMQAPW